MQYFKNLTYSDKLEFINKLTINSMQQKHQQTTARHAM